MIAIARQGEEFFLALDIFDRVRGVVIVEVSPRLSISFGMILVIGKSDVANTEKKQPARFASLDLHLERGGAGVVIPKTFQIIGQAIEGEAEEAYR